LLGDEEGRTDNGRREPELVAVKGALKAGLEGREGGREGGEE
jgi:hypothetical protein